MDSAILPPAAPAARRAPAEVRITLLGALPVPASVHNRGGLAQMRASASPAAGAHVNWRRSLLAISTLAVLGTMAYWTFGRPVFSSGASRAADEPVSEPTPAGGHGTGWWVFDRLMRKSWG